MPNPFNNIYSRPTSMPAPNHGVEPIVENVADAEAYEPYRGFENVHGINGPHHLDPVMDWEQGNRDAITYESVPREIEPVPVVIVRESTHELRTIHTGVAYPDTQVRQILGKNTDRIDAKIKNLGPNKCWIGTNSVSPLAGYQLDSLESLTLTVTEAVYVVSDGTAPSPLTFIQQVSVSVHD